MTEKLEFYRCKVCGNVVQVILNGVGELVCCSVPMEKIVPNVEENVTKEFHIPVYIKDANGENIIQVGKEEHPMTAEHHIEFIERVSSDKNKIILEYLDKEKPPIVKQCTNLEAESAYELCNLHGMWEGKNLE